MKNTILIIEDDEIVRLTIIEFLELNNFSVLSAEDGLWGLQLAKVTQPDLIISDFKLPKANGLFILEELRQDWTSAKIPFIFMTGETNPEICFRARELGANDYLIKPIDLYILLDAITNQLKGYS
jgi:DNA-binding response OmpR family regulator